MSPLDLDLVDATTFLLHRDGGTERVDLHDYARIYAVPGLYEELFYARLDCRSPREVVALLGEALAAAGTAPGDLRVLDLGAGNGIVAEELRALGVGSVVGLDVEPAAAEAAARDRPGAYDAYVVADLLAPPPGAVAALGAEPLTALTAVAALGFGHVPAGVLQAALELLAPGAWIALSLAPELLDEPGEDPFGQLVARLRQTGALEEVARRGFVHRRGVDGAALRAVALVSRWRPE